MIRRNLFAALVGVLGARLHIWAQETFTGVPPEQFKWTIRRIPVKPKPNECPICGEMAEPYKPGQIWCFGPDQECIPSLSKLARCKRCNGAFWQDAEKE